MGLFRDPWSIGGAALAKRIHLKRNPWSIGGDVLAKFIHLERIPWYRRLTPRQRAPAGFLFRLTPLGRVSLGGLAFLAARRVFAVERQQKRTPSRH